MTDTINISEIYSGKIEGLKHIIDQYNFTHKQLALKIDVFPSDFEKMLNGEYPYDADDFNWAKVDSFLDDLKNKIYETKLLRIVHRMLNQSFREKEIAVITSNSGAGKTEAIKRYCLINPDAIHIRVIEVFTTKYLLQKMLVGLGSSPTGLTKQQLFESISEQVSRKHKLFIIDEAERLDVKQLELLRDFYDETHVGLCFVGLDKLRMLLKSGRSLKEDLVQLYSRISYQKIVDILEPEDVKMIMDDRLTGHKISKTKFNDLSTRYKARGGLRAILKLCNLMEKIIHKNPKTFPTANDELVNHAIENLTL